MVPYLPVSWGWPKTPWQELGLKSGRDFMHEAEQAASSATWKFGVTVVIAYLVALVGWILL